MTAPVIVEPGSANIQEIQNDLVNASQSLHAQGGNGISGPLEQAVSPSSVESRNEPTVLEPATADIGTVVSKAKRAASSLWILIHAQVSSVHFNDVKVGNVFISFQKIGYSMSLFPIASAPFLVTES